jgi:Domain of unknown function (DU1801)
MAKTEVKTIENDASVEDFLNAQEDVQKIKDSFELVKIMHEVTLRPPKMWGGAIVGFGSYHYKYESGREGDSLRVGFSPRKDALALYIGAISDSNKDIIGNLGKFKSSKSCIYLKKLSDVDISVLKELIKRCFDKKHFGEV